MYKVSDYAGGHTATCPVCGNGNLLEYENEGQQRWEYECADCGYVLVFARQLKAEKGRFDISEDED